MIEQILIIGASARPWIRSALLAGFDVGAFDFFADWDSQALLKNPDRIGTKPIAGDNWVEPIAAFDEVLDPGNQDAIAECDAALILGGFESRFDLVESLGAILPILATPWLQLERICDTPAVFRLLKRQGVPIPTTKRYLDPADGLAGWLCKRMGTSGGLAVRNVIPGDISSRDPKTYFQSKLQGPSYSGVFVSWTDQSGEAQTSCLGVTEQFVGDRHFGADEFQYCGSQGPVEVPADWDRQIDRVGVLVGRQFQLNGLWGIDFVVSNTGTLYPVDINPRLTASMELFESAIGQSQSGVHSIVDLHVRACRGQLTVGQVNHVKRSIGDVPKTMNGKAILFHRGRVPIEVTTRIFNSLRRMYDPMFDASAEPGFTIADVPNVGQVIYPGAPVLTLRTRATPQQVQGQLWGRANVVYQQLSEDEAAQ